MASTEEQLCRRSGETAGHLASLNGNPDFGCPEDLREFRASLEEVDAVIKSRDQPAIMGTADSDACGIACRNLNLMFPRDDRDDDWSDRSAGEDDGDVDDDDNEKDGPWSEVASDCSTQEEGSDEDDGCNGQVRYKGKEAKCPGKYYPKSDAYKIERRWLNRYIKQLGYYANLRNEILARGEENTPFPPYPLVVFPDATAKCILGGNCYHRVYKTDDTSTTESTLGYRTPEEMLQFFSLRLSSFDPSYPVSVYGIFAVRDKLDKRRNYIFNRPRDAAVVIENQDSSVLPLCSPCRGIYVLNRALLEVDLWVKTEGGVSDDKQLLSAYAEVDIRGNFDGMHYARIIGEVCNLDIEYNAFAYSVETVIQVYAKLDHPHHVRFTALSTGYDGYEIVLFDDKLFGNAKFFQYIVAVKANEKLDVLLKVDNSLFRWSFQDEHVGAVHSPDDSIFEYGHFFVRVLFAPKNFQ
ncbi:hypothetical protein QYE76_031175 [Lolium multiflorum]|uniref:DUF6598 domain-containing protein n=1 Tax=Lolium multiflorum TaxID=4521 RepID=A0AAD8VH53_LOLMU|nr:hypothetical protein QYE76_031175 [Lolium multiflorum]